MSKVWNHLKLHKNESSYIDLFELHTIAFKSLQLISTNENENRPSSWNAHQIYHRDIKANKNLMYDFFLLFNSHPLLDYCDLKYYPGRFYPKVDLNRHKNCMLLSIAVISLIQFSFHIPLLLFLLILTFSAKNLTTAV